MQKIMVTGGAGYIGSHTIIELLKADYEVIVVDNFCNSSPKCLERVKEISGRDFISYNVDCTNLLALDKIFAKEKVDAVIHLAGLNGREHVRDAIEYYSNNIISTLNVLELMKKYNVKNLVYSSSAKVYGNSNSVPVYEDFPLSVTNPYGRTKLMIEEIIKDFSKDYPDCNIALLRYYNPIGAHPSGLIGEDPLGIPTSLIPYITQVALCKLPFLRIFGNDYPTPDGTGIRDYIHICDLASGHVLALKKLFTNCGFVIYNLGTGKGYSVFEVLLAMEKAAGTEIPYKVVARRPGEAAICYANCNKAKEELGFEAIYNLDDMCASSFNWQKKNPNGYRD